MHVKKWRGGLLVSVAALLVTGLLVVAVGAATTDSAGLRARIALLAPFEGRYREIGYNALYAARMAIREAGNLGYELMPVDDGGSEASAADRARALLHDPQVMAVIVLGYDATAPDVQQAFNDLPTLIAGNWGVEPNNGNSFILSHPRLNELITAPPRISITDAAALPAPIVGGDIFTLEQFPLLREDLGGVQIASSGSLPDESFRSRYQSGEQFAPEPGILAPLVYDAAELALETLEGLERDEIPLSREAFRAALEASSAFENGYWREAEIHYFRFDAAGNLRAVDDLIE